MLKVHPLFGLIITEAIVFSLVNVIIVDAISIDNQVDDTDLDANLLYVTANNLHIQGRYEEAIPYYERAIELWENELKELKINKNNINQTIMNISLQQENLNRTFILNERQYNSQNMMDRALNEVATAFVTSYISEIFPYPANKIVEGANTVASMPGLIGILEDTKEGLIWESDGKFRNRNEWRQLEEKRTELIKELQNITIKMEEVSERINYSKQRIIQANEAIQAARVMRAV